jgi:putative ABC transport system ATP-binding protein
MPLLQLQDVKKSFTTPEGEEHPILDLRQLQLEEQEEVALAGSSGSGKTTLLHLIAGILRPDSGKIVVDGQDLAQLGESARDRFRAQNLGYVFQSFHLLQGYSALENVLLGMLFGPGPDSDLAEDLLRRLGLAERLNYKPAQLSIGQQQRVALARALANRPRLVLADEPTGNLDVIHARDALALIREVCRERGAALLLVSHDTAILDQFERVEQLHELNQAAPAAGNGS